MDFLPGRRERTALAARVAVGAVRTAWGLAGAASAGCLTPDVKPNLADPDPSIKVPAIRQAAAEDDRSAVGPLIDDLSSDDPAVRLFAGEALRRITGRDLGYEPYADSEPRAEAVERWKLWAASRATSTPTTPTWASE